MSRVEEKVLELGAEFIGGNGVAIDLREFDDAARNAREKLPLVFLVRCHGFENKIRSMICSPQTSSITVSYHDKGGSGEKLFPAWEPQRLPLPF